MAYISGHDLNQVSIGIPIHAVVKLKPNAGYYRDDIRITQNTLSLLDANNRLRQEFQCYDIYDSASQLYKLFQDVFPSYLRAVLDGVNISVLGFGTTGSGKSFNIQGEGADPGLIVHFCQALFEALQQKRFKLNQGKGFTGYTFSVRIRYLEVYDEQISDLLLQANQKIMGNLHIFQDEQDGQTVLNASWIQASSAHQLVEMYSLGRRNRTQAVNDFGPVSQKASSIFTVEILQVQQNQNTMDTTVLVSRATFIDLPGMEKLHQDPEGLRIKQGNTMNKGILALAELINSLSKNDREYIRYDGSILTSLLEDAIGGNSLTMALFCLENGNMVGTSMVLSYMKQVQQIMNFPVVNDSRQVGLLRKYRREIIHLMNMLTALGTGNLQQFGNQVSDLERQLIEGNLEKLKFLDEKTQLTDRIKELKEAFNKIIQEKADLQQELIIAQEDRLQISKVLLQQQIKISTLQQNQANADFQTNNQKLIKESELIAQDQKEKQALEAINKIQAKMKQVLEEKREIQIQLVALKTNYLNMEKQLQAQKLKNENLSVQLINAVNANKALSGDTDYITKLQTDLARDKVKLQKQVQELSLTKTQLDKTNQAQAAEINILRAELGKYDVNTQRITQEYDQRKIELERQYFQLAQKQQSDYYSKLEGTNKKANKLQNQDEINQSNVVVLTRQLKLAQRKIAQLQDYLGEFQKRNSEKTQQVHNLSLKIDELRGNYRANLLKTMNQYNNNQILQAAKQQLVQSYNQKQKDLLQKLQQQQAFNAHNMKLIRGLKAYSQALKNLAQDWAPLGQPKPEILIKPPPILVQQDDSSKPHRVLIQANQVLKLKNLHLETELKKIAQHTANARDTSVQEKLIEEIQQLKGTQQSRPGSRNYSVEQLRNQRNFLREQNRKLHNEIREMSGKVGGELQAEIDRLRKRLRSVQSGRIDQEGGGGDKKVKYLEEVLRQLEKERSELSVRATMAEEQLKNLQEHMNNSTVKYQRQIAELQKMLQGRR